MDFSNCLSCGKSNNILNVYGYFSFCEFCIKKLNINTTQFYSEGCIVYLRVSTKKQVNDNTVGLKLQLKQCFDFCLKNNLYCANIYYDIYSGRDIKKLIGFNELLNDIGINIYETNNKKIKTILNSNDTLLLESSKNISDEYIFNHSIMSNNIHIKYILSAYTDRFGRNSNHLNLIRNYLQENRNIEMINAFSFNLNKQMRDITFKNESMQAEIFSMDRSMRITNAKQKIKENGGFTGGVTKFGYRTEIVNSVRVLVKDEKEQEIIKIIERKYNKVENLSYVLNYLNTHNILRRGKQWTKSNLRIIIKEVKNEDELVNSFNEKLSFNYEDDDDFIEEEDEDDDYEDDDFIEEDDDYEEEDEDDVIIKEVKNKKLPVNLEDDVIMLD